MDFNTHIWPQFLFLMLFFTACVSLGTNNLKAQTLTLDQEIRSLEKKLDRLPRAVSPEALKSNNGDWIGRFVVDKESLENCTLKISDTKAYLSGQLMTLTFNNDGVQRKLALTLDGKNNFSEWLTMTLQYLEHNRFLDRAFNLKGKIDSNILTGIFHAELTRIGDSCSGDMYFVKKGTLEAKAYLENRDPRIVRLEHRLAQLRKAPPSGSSKQAPAQTAILEKAVEELMRFRALQKKEQRRLAALKKESKTQAKKLAALKQARQEIVSAQQKRKAAIRKKQRLKQVIERSRITKDFGTYHALIIGIDKYKNLPRLKTAIADANAIAAVLKQQYGFKIHKLLNPTRETILDAIDDLRSALAFNDNLLIYYSGHGQLDQKADEGYWLPVNAKSDRRSRWLSTNTLSSSFRAFKAKHVMVVADSCYSGRLTRGISVRPRSSGNLKFLKKLAQKKARVVLTSGGLQPVDDDNGSGHSPFADALLKTLNENKGIFDGTSLFKSVRRPVQLETRNQEPQYSDLRRAGHGGGDFIFVKEGSYAK